MKLPCSPAHLRHPTQRRLRGMEGYGAWWESYTGTEPTTLAPSVGLGVSHHPRAIDETTRCVLPKSAAASVGGVD